LRILIADSHDVVRRWVRAALASRPEWAVCAEARTGPETVAKTIEVRPDVVLLGARLSGLTSAEITREISRVAPDSVVLTLTAFTSDVARRHDNARGAREAGHTLMDAIKALVDNPPPADHDRPRADDSHAAGAGERSRKREEIGTTLTSREGEVLRQLADGRSNKEIGVILGISTRTVETHRARLMRKLGLHSMNQLVRYAIRQRIISV